MRQRDGGSVFLLARHVQGDDGIDGGCDVNVVLGARDVVRQRAVRAPLRQRDLRERHGKICLAADDAERLVFEVVVDDVIVLLAQLAQAKVFGHAEVVAQEQHLRGAEVGAAQRVVLLGTAGVVHLHAHAAVRSVAAHEEVDADGGRRGERGAGPEGVGVQQVALADAGGAHGAQLDDVGRACAAFRHRARVRCARQVVPARAAEGVLNGTARVCAHG